MMSVKEYANDVNREVEEIIRKCSELNIKASNEDDMLMQEDIIELDNVLMDNEDESDIDEFVKEEEKFLLAEEIAEDLNVDDTVKVQKLVKKKDKKPEVIKTDIHREKKKMYKNKKKLQNNTQVEESDTIYISDGITVRELSEKLDVDAKQIITKLIALGYMLNVNSPLEFEVAELIALDYNIAVKTEASADVSDFDNFEIVDNESDLTKRPPVVTIMGHVDHGKTTLLDTIRKSSVASGEAGGITQNISAYQVNYKGEPITFIDTPGHAAFTQMRERGAKVTDIIIIIVAADDGVMVQTKEAIDHAKAAGVPIIVAINKIDKPNVNIDRIYSDLSEAGLTPEEWGGNTMITKISALSNLNIDELLDNILLIAEMENYTANVNRYALGTVIESHLDKSTGVNATMLVQNGTLRIGDPVVVGTSFGKVRVMKDDLGNQIVSAKPGSPITITGLNKVPNAGDRFMAFETEKEAKEVRDKRLDAEKVPTIVKKVSLEDLLENMNKDTREVNVVLKADVKGSEEAIKGALAKVNVEGITVKVISSGVGAITESDVILASASNAILIGFNTRPSGPVEDIIKANGVDVRLYSIIYKVVEEIEAALKGMLEPIYEEKLLGEAVVRKIFKFSKIGSIAGSYCQSGVIKNGSRVRVVRDGNIVHDGKIASIQREKDQVKEVKTGIECGITIENFDDLMENDILESYELVVVERK